MGTDAWSQFLKWLETVIVPDWGGVIALLPLLLVLGVLGPGLSLLALMHLHHRLTRKKGRVRLAEAASQAAPRDEFGAAVIPPNLPFCARHELLHPATGRTCDVDGEELSVRCPVDGATRPAREQVCRTCGTRYVLGATSSALVVRRTGRPPEGGAAIA